MHGYTKPYFIDETGRLFRDETGNLDHFDTIPMEVVFGRNNLGNELPKALSGALVNSERARGAQLLTSVDNGEFLFVGELDKTNKRLDMRNLPAGHDVNYKISHNSPGEAPIINGITTYFSQTETQYAAR